MKLRSSCSFTCKLPSQANTQYYPLILIFCHLISLTSEPPWDMPSSCTGVTSKQVRLGSGRCRELKWRKQEMSLVVQREEQEARSISLYVMNVGNPEEEVASLWGFASSKIQRTNAECQPQMPVRASCSEEEDKQEDVGKACQEESS